MIKTGRIGPTVSVSEQTLPTSKRNLAENPPIKKKKEKFLLANIAADPRVKIEEHTKLTLMTNVGLKMINHLLCSKGTPTWARRQERIRIRNPRVM